MLAVTGLQTSCAALQESRTSLIEIKVKLSRMIVERYLGKDSTFPNGGLEAARKREGLESNSKGISMNS